MILCVKNITILTNNYVHLKEKWTYLKFKLDYNIWVSSGIVTFQNGWFFITPLIHMHMASECIFRMTNIPRQPSTFHVIVSNLFPAYIQLLESLQDLHHYFTRMSPRLSNPQEWLFNMLIHRPRNENKKHDTQIKIEDLKSKSPFPFRRKMRSQAYSQVIHISWLIMSNPRSRSISWTHTRETRLLQRWKLMLIPL